MRPALSFMPAGKRVGSGSSPTHSMESLRRCAACSISRKVMGAILGGRLPPQWRPMQALSRQQLVVLACLTLVWGVNWPVMKLGVTDFPPLTFRALSILLGVPVLAIALVALKVPFRLPQRHWPELAKLTITNMLIWHICIILAVRALSSGRAAILGYTMPIFSAVIGAMLFSAVLTRRAWLGVGAAAIGVALLLWHEFTGLAG